MVTSSKRLRAAARRTFLRIFPDGFRDELYLAWERDYKVDADRRWRAEVGGEAELRAALEAGRHREVAAAAVRVEAGRPLLFSFEKMALRDAVLRSEVGAHRFAEGLYDWLHGPGASPDASSVGPTWCSRSHAARPEWRRGPWPPCSARSRGPASTCS